MTEPISEFRLRRRVQFYEVDSAGIVHFSWYFRYMEEAEHGLWRSAGLSCAPTPELAFPRVASAFEWRRPLRFEDEFDILIQIASLGERRISYACTMTRDGETLATGTMTVACATLGPPLRGIPVPARIARCFASAQK